MGMSPGPHMVLPFVVEHADALGKEANELFQRCHKIAVDQISPQLHEVSTWSSDRGFSNYFLQTIPSDDFCRQPQGTGHFFVTAAALAGGP